MIESKEKKQDFNEIEIYQLIDFFKNGWKLLLTSIVLATIISSIYALSLDNIYRSKSTLMITGMEQSFSSSGLSRITETFGFQVNSSDSKTTLVISTLSSRGFFKTILDDYKFLPQIAASSGFDISSNQLILDDSEYDEQTQSWRPNKKPSFERAYRIFSKNLNVTEDNGLITISYDHLSPVFAQEIILAIVEQINEIMRTRDLIESQNSINFLKSKIQNEQILDIRSSLNQIMLNELKKEIFANIKKDFILEYVDRPYIPETKYSPQRSLIVLVTAFMSVIFAFMYIIFSGRYK